MIQEYFWKHDNKMFFHYGNYSEQKKRGPKNMLDNLYMIDSLDEEEKITSFDMIHPNSDADVSKEACPSLLEWANYLLEPYADIDNNDDSKLNNDNNLKGPMQSYKITDDEIKWKKKQTPTQQKWKQLHQLQRKNYYGVNLIGVLRTSQTLHWYAILQKLCK